MLSLDLSGTVITENTSTNKYQGSWDPEAAALPTPPASPGPVWGTVRFSSPHSFSKAQFSHNCTLAACFLIPFLSFQQGLARHLEKPCQDMTVQQGAPKIQPQHHDPRGSFSLRKEPPTVSQQCKPFSCLPSVPRGSCRGIHFTAAPDGSTASPSPCYDGLSAMSGCWEGHLVSFCR